MSDLSIKFSSLTIESEKFIVFDQLLRDIRDRIQSQQYVMTIHAEEEMAHDQLSILDIESGILTGEILERQLDRVTAESNLLYIYRE